MGDRVFVKIDKEEDKTTSGILLPSSAQKKPTQGEIVDIGDAKALKVWVALRLSNQPQLSREGFFHDYCLSCALRVCRIIHVILAACE